CRSANASICRSFTNEIHVDGACQQKYDPRPWGCGRAAASSDSSGNSSMDGPELAIIITTYQMPRHLRLVLESIAVQQTRRRLEVVVADDGSTDETRTVVEAFARRMSFPVRFVTHPHTQFHAARCRNEGVRHS